MVLKKFSKASKKSGQGIWRKLGLQQEPGFQNVPPWGEREPGVANGTEARLVHDNLGF